MVLERKILPFLYGNVDVVHGPWVVAEVARRVRTVLHGPSKGPKKSPVRRTGQLLSRNTVVPFVPLDGAAVTLLLREIKQESMMIV